MKLKVYQPFKPIISVSFLIIGIIFCFSSCQKNDHTPSAKNSSNLSLYLTDDPADYKEIWIDIQQAQVQLGNDSSQGSSWQSLVSPHPGKYNLLQFRNGVDTLFASGTIPSGKVSAIKLMLGNNNSLVFKDGQTVPLVIASGPQKQLMLQIENTYTKPDSSKALVLDFDAAHSIVSPGSKDSGNFILNPSIRVFEKGAGASIQGWVYPAAAEAYVQAFSQPGDTLLAIPDYVTGFYKFWGIPGGTYTINFVAGTATGYQNFTLKNIQAVESRVIQVDTVTLHK